MENKQKSEQETAKYIQETGDNDRVTIADIADALQISKTTVSRAISGKGRIGEETRARVLAYIEQCNYRPNPLAKGLAQLRTYNIGWVMPGDSDVTDLPFFQRCMIGISEVAATHDYDILLSMVYDKDMSQLERIVRNRKIDGLILGRTLIQDDRVAFLKKMKVPFVVIGSTPVEQVVQIDNDHVAACRELTAILLLKGLKKLALIGGDSNHVVNMTRKKGFEQGLETQQLAASDALTFMDCNEMTDVFHAVEECVRSKVDCIICMDDRICTQVLEKLKNDHIKMPEQIKIASFYDSVLLDNAVPAITALQYDPRNLGVVAAKTLFQLIDGEEVNAVTYLNYEVALRGSTQ